MPVTETCSDCIRLLEVLAEATHAHIKILGQSQFAAMQHDAALFAYLDPQVLAASNRRTIARSAYQDHAAVHQHGPK